MGKVYLIDSNSLLTLVRYYLVFDEEMELFGHIKEQFDSERILLLESVHKEISYISGGMVLKQIPFLKDETKKIKNNDGSPISSKLHRIINDHWAVHIQKEKLNESQYEEEKNKFLNSADAQLLFQCQEDSQNRIIATEESRVSNDNKTFKKIPQIADHQQLTWIALPEMLKKVGITIKFHAES